jgi:hypothetical protein
VGVAIAEAAEDVED